MTQGEDAGVGVVGIEDGLEAEVGELGGDFGGAFGGLDFDHEGVRSPSHDRNVVSTAEFAGGVEPGGICSSGICEV